LKVAEDSGIESEKDKYHERYAYCRVTSLDVRNPSSHNRQLKTIGKSDGRYIGLNKTHKSSQCSFLNLRRNHPIRFTAISKAEVAQKAVISSVDFTKTPITERTFTLMKSKAFTPSADTTSPQRDSAPSGTEWRKFFQ
jgi:hypothetical protein